MDDICFAYEGTDIIMSTANNKVPGYPLEIFDFVSGSGSYIIFAGQIYHTACRISYRTAIYHLTLPFHRFYAIIHKSTKQIKKRRGTFSIMKCIDIHTHTNHSDGTSTVENSLRCAEELGLSVFSGKILPRP